MEAWFNDSVFNDWERKNDYARNNEDVIVVLGSYILEAPFIQPHNYKNKCENLILEQTNAEITNQLSEANQFWK